MLSLLLAQYRPFWASMGRKLGGHLLPLVASLLRRCAGAASAARVLRRGACDRYILGDVND